MRREYKRNYMIMIITSACNGSLKQNNNVFSHENVEVVWSRHYSLFSFDRFHAIVFGVRFIFILFYFRLVSDLLINSRREEVKFLIWKIYTHRISKRMKSKVRSCVSFSRNFSSSGKYTGGTIVIRLSVLMSFSQQRSTWSVSRNSWDEKWF